MSAPATPRVAISLAPGERDALRELAHAAGEPIATTAGRLIRAALADHGAKLDTPPARRTGPPAARSPRRRPTPAEPTTAIDALRARYPHETRHLPANLDADTLVAEHLAALAAWRTDLDTAGTDANPRETLAFTDELRRTATWLQDRARRGR